MAIYNWQLPDWPHFRYTLNSVEDILLRFSEKLGRVSGILEALPADVQQDVQGSRFSRLREKMEVLNMDTNGKE